MKPISLGPPHPVYSFQAELRGLQFYVSYTLTRREDGDADVNWQLKGIYLADDARIQKLSDDLTPEEERIIGGLAVKDAGLDPIDINMIDG